MEQYFQFEQDYNPNEDKVMTLIKDVRAKNLNYPSGLVFKPLEEIESMDRIAAGEALTNKDNQSWGFLETERNIQFKELDLVIEHLLKFYTTRWDYNYISTDGLTPQEITYFLNRFVIRLNRLMCVLDPKYSFTSATKKSTGKSYDMVKAYWIDDDGNKVRSFTKNLGNSETSMIELPEKLVAKYNKDAVVFQPVLKNGFSPDLVIAIDGKKWVVETKILNKENYSRTFVTFELWEKYKETYTLY